MRSFDNMKGKKWKKAAGAIAVLALVVLALWFWNDRHQNSLTKEGEKQTDGTRPVPDKASIEADSKKVAEGINIRVMAPTVNATVSSPLKISGEAKGYYFEASFPVKLIDEKGNVLGQGEAKAKGDWMKDAYVPFEAELKFDAKGAKAGDLVFQKSNPSGKPENAGSFSFPVLIGE
jgi:hypothetical protein